MGKKSHPPSGAFPDWDQANDSQKHRDYNIRGANKKISGGFLESLSKCWRRELFVFFYIGGGHRSEFSGNSFPLISWYLNQLAGLGVKQKYPISDRHERVIIMRHDDGCLAKLLVCFLDQISDLTACGWIEPRSWFVVKNRGRVVGQRSGDGESLSLSPAQS